MNVQAAFHPLQVLPWLLEFTALLAVVVAAWAWRAHRQRRLAQRRAAGYQLLDCLKAYSAWMDWHRDEPISAQNLDELSSPAPLAKASEIKDRWFPELGGLLVQLLRSHRLMMEYLWEQNILRMSGGSLHERSTDTRYQELRDLQDATLDSLFLRCRQLIGDSDPKWHRTRSDFSFSNSIHSQPSSRA